LNPRHGRLSQNLAVITAGLAILAGASLGGALAVAQQNSTPAVDRLGERGLRGPSEGRGGKGRRTRAAAGPRGQRQEGDGGEFHIEVPAHPVDLILARPTQRSITLSVLSYENVEGYVAYGTEHGQHAKTTPPGSFKAGESVKIEIGDLQPNTRYYYEFRSRDSVEAAFERSPEYTFHTARPSGGKFTFTVTADSHLDEQTDLGTYRQTLTNAVADAPDFHIDLGDTFMTEKHASRESAAKQYVAQRYYFGLIGYSVPLYLVLGNHDGESGRYLDGTADNLAVWSNTMRKKYFSNPQPDGFYTGNTVPDPFAGPLQDYYAWEWGDALFVVLDPFWFAPRLRGGGDNWTRTLGAEQYQWLRRTLQQSRAKFKFVFIHHLVGGADKQSRGGAEAAPFYEWGGKNADGSRGFEQHRPGWPAPIHQLLVEAGVSIVFHGHDHLFAKQDLDGIVYQEVPQPGLRRYNTPRTAAEYGYAQGHILGGPGHLRIAVSPDQAAVGFVSSCLPKDETADRRNRDVGYRYNLP